VGEGGLTAQPFGVLAGGCQQLAGMVVADREQLQQPGSGPTDEDGQPLVGQGDLLVQQLDALGDHHQRGLGPLDWVGQRGLVRAQPGAGDDQRRGGAAVQRFSQAGRSGDQQRLELVDGRGAGLDRATAGGAQRPDRLHDPVASLGDRGRGPGQHGPGGRLGVDRVRLAPLAAGPTVGSVDLHHPHALVQEHLGQSGAVAAGAFHPDRTQLPMAM
jgi:hypothetical protein